MIYNPAAGKLHGKGFARVEAALAILAQAGHHVDPRPTPGPGTAGALARQSIAEGADLIVACGGDGTLNETAEGVIGSDTPFAILPGGTANVLAHEMRLGNDIARAARVLADGEVRRIPVGRLRLAAGGVDRHFLMMAGVGLDAHIVYQMNPAFKKKWGKASYWIAGFREVSRRLEEFDVEIDGGRHSASFALFAKTRNYGGDLEIARRVRLFDDAFEAVLFAGPSAVRYLKYFAGVALHSLDGMAGVTILRGRTARFSGSSAGAVHAQIDGEYAGEAPGSVEIVPQALSLLVPRGFDYGAN